MLFDTRKSTWYSRSAYVVPGLISGTLAVPDVRLRLSDERTSALEYDRVARICGPGRLWNVALVCSPHQGSGYTARPLTFGWNGGVTSQFSRACGESTTKQLFVATRPTLAPPDATTPRGNRAFTLTSTPLKISVGVPKTSAFEISVFWARIRLASYSPHTWNPPPPGKRESSG